MKFPLAIGDGFGQGERMDNPNRGGFMEIEWTAAPAYITTTDEIIACVIMGFVVALCIAIARAGRIA